MCSTAARADVNTTIFPNCESSESSLAVRSYMILELHRNAIQPMPPQMFEVGEYYAVDFVKSFYFGRVLHINDEIITFKYLHPVRLGKDLHNLFDWPRRNDIAEAHVSCVFYGPIHLQGNSPFTVMELDQVKRVFLHYSVKH